MTNRDLSAYRPRMERDLARYLLALLSAFQAADGRLKASTIARYAAGDWRFFRVVELIASGERQGTFTVRKYDEVVAWFFSHWPDGAAWPEGVPRPASGPMPAEGAPVGEAVA